MLVFRLLSLFAVAASAARAADGCTVAWDGRISSSAALTDFESSSSPYDPSFVYGENLEWSSILDFPSSNATSLFDKAGHKAVEVTISDESIFAPSADNRQTGFRRAELLPDGGDAIVTGIKTLHFSIQADAARPLNYSHEYQLVFVETADYSTNQLVLKTGTILTGSPNVATNVLQLQGTQASSQPQTIFTSDFTPGTWYNYGIVLDFDQNTVEVLFSEGSAPLVSKTSPTSNDLSGKGQWHFGLLKKPTGQVSDITKQGYQESGINEGVIFGGIFFEDSSSGCVSKS